MAGLPSSSQAKKQQSISSFFASKPSLESDSGNAGQPAAERQPAALADLQTGNARNGQKAGLTPTSTPKTKTRVRSRTITSQTTAARDPHKPDTPSPAQRPTKRARVAAARPDNVEEADDADRVGGSAGPADRLSQDTSQYTFSSSRRSDGVHTDDDRAGCSEAERTAKELLHKQFVDKLGRLDGLFESRSRSKPGLGDDMDVDGGSSAGTDDSDAAADEPPAKKGKKGKAASKSAAGKPLTPLEKQVIEIKTAHPDAVLVVEVGYKFQFFGRDAQVASQQLGILCIPGRMEFNNDPAEAHLSRFASASIPTHRLHVHVKRLVDAGHKVGVVRQTETAALKAAGKNRSGPFVRRLTNLYTRATYVDEADGPDSNLTDSSSAGHILCLVEAAGPTDGAVRIGLVAVQPTTGEVIYDSFVDTFMRSELETRLLHIAPAEFVLVGSFSAPTERLVTHVTTARSRMLGDQARVERVPTGPTAVADSVAHLSTVYPDGTPASDAVGALPEDVSVCLSALVKHLGEYGLDRLFDLIEYFRPFILRSHMLLNGNTVTSLEIYQNQTDYTAKGSLFWCVDYTKTRSGRRMLRKWVGQPLVDEDALTARLDAVEELIGQHDSDTAVVSSSLDGIRSDLEKVLVRLYYGRCRRSELYYMLNTLRAVGGALCPDDQSSGRLVRFQSPVLTAAIACVGAAVPLVTDFLSRIRPAAARRDDKLEYFQDGFVTSQMTSHRNSIVQVEDDLDRLRVKLAGQVGKTSMNYVTVAGIEYLVEIDNKLVKNVPGSWIKISGTKKVSRFHPPELIQLLRRRDEHAESLQAAADDAFTAFMTEIATDEHYSLLRQAIQHISVLDCLLSLATASRRNRYVRPRLTKGGEIDITAGRHPMVERLLVDDYVPNDVRLASTARVAGTADCPARQASANLVTGPNMGGKSSFVRQTALINIMAQFGSFVPAEKAHLPILDAVYTRMGASDRMIRGESTFMVEMSETAEIVRNASPASLVILDELGRGTSTHDGYAIAEAVCRYVVEDIGAFMLFVTHYQGLAGLEDKLGGALRNVHMGFEHVGDAGSERVTFLYKVKAGMAHRSYGLNVARLANLPTAVLTTAAAMSARLEEVVLAKKVNALVEALDRPDRILQSESLLALAGEL